MKKTLGKDIWRSIRHSKGRFVSIVLLMLLGSLALVGLKVTGPNMRATGIDYFDDLNLADLSVIGTYGLDQGDQELINEIPGLDQVEYGYFKDVVPQESQASLRLFSKTETISTYQLKEGRLPDAIDEIALDYSYQGDYHLGDTIKFEEKADASGDKMLAQDTFTITGFLYTGEILSDINLGPSTAGTSELKGYGVVIPQVFQTDNYMVARLTFADLDGVDPYSQSYQDRLKDHQADLEAAFDEGKSQRLDRLKSEKQNEIDQAQEDLKAGQKAIYKKKQAVSDKEAQLAQLIPYQATLPKDQQDKVKQAQREIDQAKEELQAADTDITDKEEKIQAAQNQVDHLEAPTFLVYTRREAPGGEGYKIYSSINRIIDALANVFPVFMYFVAALVALTTMTRFVEEERTKSGTLMALGYTDRDIITKFILYGFLSSSLGAVLGIILGHTFIPLTVYHAYSGGFTVPEIQLHFYGKISLIAFTVAVLCGTVPAYLIAKKGLQAYPAQLLRPKAPAAGANVFLENLPGLWKRLSFMQKNTARNLIRYKSRSWMTIFGVAGAVSLLFAGFSVQDSIRTVNNQQFGDLIHYEMIVAQKPGIDEEQSQDLQEALDSNQVDQYLNIHYENLSKVAGKKLDKQDIKLIVPQNEAKFHEYLSLQNRSSGQVLSLADDGIIISERLARLLNVQVGDGVTFEDRDGRDYDMKVSGITEMYMGHFAFTTSRGYENIFGKDYSTNASMVQLKDQSTSNVEAQSAEFMNLDGVMTVVQNTTLTNQVNTIVNSLDKIMKVLILVAVLLGVVILYNLTTINVSERMRELSTIKVLGFYDKEVTMYIYRETIILTMLGLLAGYVIGEGLHQYILWIVSPDNIMFNPALTPRSFALPAIIIAIITIILGLLINHRLKEVDMLEALSGVE
ncbi:FtsX-like permease family protein [Aerococcus mictus]|uniref:FtsX-like permease family protein n=1 Tax=Aerococcus mictus TaxID=2976810 RepID=UPI00227BF6CC|nr:FtsX-like permease family protein [Aerococcus mictus]MCY3082802.1 FtsX-like permease family protein [Aerococcus mictus]